MTRMRTLCHLIAIISSYTMLFSAPADGLRVTHVVGGQATTLVLADSYWYQAIGDRLAILELQSSADVATVMLSEHPAGGTCNALLLVGKTLYALLDSQEIVILDCSNAKVPKITKRILAHQLGIQPNGLALVGSWPCAFGTSGVVRIPDCKRLLECDGEVSGVAISIDKGVVCILEGQLIDADTGESFGPMSELYALEDDANADIGSLVSVSNPEGQQETILKLLRPGLKPVNEQKAIVSIPQVHQRVFIRGSRVIVATDSHIYIIGIAPSELRVLKTLPLKGVRDVAVIASNYLAVCGEFGRGLYRIRTDKGGEGESLLRVKKAAGTFSAGYHNRHGVQIPSTSGFAHYKFRESLEYGVSETETAPQQVSAVVLGWRAAIDPETSEVFLIDSDDELIPLPIPTASSIVPISGNFWVGTSDGIYVFGDDGNGNLVELASVNISGPVVQLIPQFDGSAVFVTSTGFAGIVQSNQETLALEQ